MTLELFSIRLTFALKLIKVINLWEISQWNLHVNVFYFDKMYNIICWPKFWNWTLRKCLIGMKEIGFHLRTAKDLKKIRYVLGWVNQKVYATTGEDGRRLMEVVVTMDILPRTKVIITFNSYLAHISYNNITYLNWLLFNNINQQLTWLFLIKFISHK